MIVNLNGWPGVGKLTVGLLLADKVQGRLLDNHSIQNVAIALTEHGSDAYYRATRAVRAIAFDAILLLPPELPIILTNVNAFGGSQAFAEENWQAIINLAKTRGGPLFSITLTCAADELARRITAHERRLNRKMQDPEEISRIVEQRQLFDEGADYRITIDTTHLVPATCVNKIVSWIGDELLVSVDDYAAQERRPPASGGNADRSAGGMTQPAAQDLHLRLFNPRA